MFKHYLMKISNIVIVIGFGKITSVQAVNILHDHGGKGYMIKVIR